MILERAGETISQAATAADITQALAKPGGSDGPIKLTAKTGDYIEARRDEAGAIRVAYQERASVHYAQAALTETQLRAALLSYLARDGRWKRICQTPAAAAPSAFSSLVSAIYGPPESRKKLDIPMPVAIVATGVGILLTILPWIPNSLSPLRLLPGFMRDAGGVTIIFLSMPLLILVGLAAKLMEVHKARHWPQAAGRIVHSAIEAKEVRNVDGEPRVVNVPAIAYEFTANGFPRSGTRVSIGEDPTGANTEATLARYPVGANIVVHYNPNDPGDCVLDYSTPFTGMGQGCATSLASLAVIGGLVYYVYRNFGRLEAALPPGANPKLMIFSGLFGVVTLGAFLSGLRRPRWPRTPGKVMESRVESFVHMENNRFRTSYRPVVEYAFTVRDHDYRSQQIALNWTVSGAEGLAQKMAAKYPVGATVTVFYDPANPSHAALDLNPPFNWLLLLTAMLTLGVALYASKLAG
jgi:hypothetical protein